MAGVNKVILIGNLGRDPEVRYTQGGQAICKLNLATTRSYTNRQTNERVEETEWHRVSVWGKQAEHCSNYLAKGRSVYVEGRLRTSSYDKEGQKHYSTEIVADTVQFLGGRDAGASQGQGASQGGGYNNNNGPRGGSASSNEQGPPQGGGSEPYSPGEFIPPGPEEDDIPF